MLGRPMQAAILALALAVSLASLVAAAAPVAAVVAVPEEPSVMLVDEATYDVALADLDDDGAREIVALVEGERGTIVARAWTESRVGWREVGPPLEVVPSDVTPGWALAPVKLLVLADGARDRLVLLRQPSDPEPDLGVPCCLLIDLLELVEGGLRARDVAPITDKMDAAFGLDLDGDGTDELVTTRSEPPLGDITFPTVANVYRLADDRFGPPTTTDLPIGSGDTPFVLGDSDGRPGEELAVIATLGRPELYRLALGDGDRLTVEDAGFVATDALAVPIGQGRGTLVVDEAGWSLRPWPSLGPLGDPVVSGEYPGGRIVGVVGGATSASAVVAARIAVGPVVIDLDTFNVGLPAEPPPSLDASPVLVYHGTVPSTSRHDAAWAIVDGQRWSAGSRASAPARVARFAGAVPVGFAGVDGRTLVVHHGRMPARTDAALMPPTARPGSGVGIVVASDGAEADGGVLAPPLRGTVPLDGGVMAVARGTAFSAEIAAPAGSRVYVASEDPSALESIAVVPSSGALAVPMAVPALTTPNPRYDASLVVVTPGGATYQARWSISVLTEPPELEVHSRTRLASGSVQLDGETDAYAEILVDGRPVGVDDSGRFSADVEAPPWPTEVTVEARDPVGNVATTSLTVVGWFDYRALPWVPIGGIVVAVTAVALFLRVPRPVAAPRRSADDGVLEELDPDLD
jgi:hypothetical protein